MQFLPTDINDVKLIQHDVFEDYRGSFVKIYQRSKFIEQNFQSDFSECYYTDSKKGVIRGMHFQLPPHNHAKLVTIIHGTVVDVILDLRKNSNTFLRYYSVELSRENRKSIYIPSGCAHGFGVLSNSAIVCYMTSTEHMPSHDVGIRYDSIGYKWEISNPVLSVRDTTFPTLSEFMSFFES